MNKSRNLDFANSGYWVNRRTIRSFTNQEIPEHFIFNLIEKASKAPTTGGMQLYSVVVTKDSKLIEELAIQHFNQPAATGAKLMLTIVADFNRFDHWCRINDADPGFNNFESFIAALLDAVIFAQQLTTLMELEGLGVCYLGTTTYNASKIGEILELPQLVIPVVTLSIGWPADDGIETERLPTGALIHYEKYQTYTDDRIKEIFSMKENLPSNKRFIEENGVPSLAHVFTQIRYPRSNAEIFGKDFFDYIEKQGFHFPKNNY